MPPTIHRRHVLRVTSIVSAGDDYGAV